MPNEVDDFLKDVKGEPKADTFIQEESDPLADKGAVPPPADDVDEGEEKPLPFHKDPKIQRFIQKEIERLQKKQPSEVQKFQRETGTDTDELMESLVEIIGNDTPQKVSAINKFYKNLSGLKQQGADQAIAQMREQAEAEQAEVARAEDELTDAFDNIESEFGVDITSNTAAAKKVRNGFIDFVKRVSPKNEDGDIVQYPDFAETWKLYQSTGSASSENTRAKSLASRSMQRSTDTGGAPATGRTWKDIDRIFSKL